MSSYSSTHKSRNSSTPTEERCTSRPDSLPAALSSMNLEVQGSNKESRKAHKTVECNEAPSVSKCSKGWNDSVCCEMLEEPVDILEEVRLSWVDDPSSVKFKGHRALQRYENDLKLVSSTLKRYTRSSGKADKTLLDAMLQYGLKAHKVYTDALHQWMENNPDSFARNQVASLIANYPEEEINRLHRYHARALKDPDNRTISTQSTQSTLYSQSNFSAQSLKIIEEQKKEIAELRRQEEIMKLALEEKEMDKQVAVKKTELALKRSEVELETYKNLARDASDIMEAEDFHRVRNSYNGKVSFDVNKLSHNMSTGGPSRSVIRPGISMGGSDMMETGLELALGGTHHVWIWA